MMHTHMSVIWDLLAIQDRTMGSGLKNTASAIYSPMYSIMRTHTACGLVLIQGCQTLDNSQVQKKMIQKFNILHKRQKKNSRGKIFENSRRKKNLFKKRK